MPIQQQIDGQGGGAGGRVKNRLFARDPYTANPTGPVSSFSAIPRATMPPGATAPTSPSPARTPSGQVGSTIVPAAVAPPPSPSVPNENDFLAGDSTFLNQQAAFKAALEDYINQKNQSLAQYQTNYNVQKSDLGFDPANPTGLFGHALDDTDNDFASRGMINSGLFADARSQLTNQFKRRQDDADRLFGDFRTNQESDFTNFNKEQGLATDRARADALARRAMQFQLV